MRSDGSLVKNIIAPIMQIAPLIKTVLGAPILSAIAPAIRLPKEVYFIKPKGLIVTAFLDRAINMEGTITISKVITAQTAIMIK